MGEDEYEETRSVEEQIEDAIRAEDATSFVILVNFAHANNISFRSIPVRAPELLWAICEYRSSSCARALVTGETSLTVDLNVPSVEDFCPLHYAAYELLPRITQILLDHGARTDLRCKQKLPLNLAVENMSKYCALYGWTPKLSIFKLLIILCLPKLRNAMETISLIVSKTSETEDEAMQYARNGKVVEVAILLTATERRNHPMSTPLLRKIFSSQIDALALESRLVCDNDKSKATMLEDKKKVLMSGLHFLEVFERVRDVIAAYMNKNNRNASFEQPITDVISLLQQAGFVLKLEDIDVSDMKWFKDEKDSALVMQSMIRDAEKFKNRTKGPDMQYYSFCGFNEKPKYVAYVPNERWKTAIIPPSPPIVTPAADAEVKNIVKETRSVEQQIEDAIRAHDATSFVTLVNYAHANNISFRTYGGSIPVRAPELFWAICEYRSYTCARALVTGTTSLTVDLNVPCVIDFCALHHAAYRHTPGIAEILIDHGARTDLRCKGMLPLNAALKSLSDYHYLLEWTPKLSIFKLLIMLCLPNMRHSMKTISLIASKTRETESEALKYAKNGKLVEVTILLMATELQTHPMLTFLVRAEILSQIDALGLEGRLLGRYYDVSKMTMLDNKIKVLMSGLHFVDVIEKVHDDIAAYMKKDNRNDNFGQPITDVVCLLQQAGFVLKPEDTDFSHMKWFKDDKLLAEEMQSFKRDVEKLNNWTNGLGMPHYSWSGYNGKPKSGAFVPTVPTDVIPPTVADAEFKNTVKGVEPYLLNVLRSRPWEVAASFIRRALRHI